MFSVYRFRHINRLKRYNYYSKSVTKTEERGHMNNYYHGLTEREISTNEYNIKSTENGCGIL